MLSNSARALITRTLEDVTVREQRRPVTEMCNATEGLRDFPTVRLCFFLRFHCGAAGDGFVDVEFVFI